MMLGGFGEEGEGDDAAEQGRVESDWGDATETEEEEMEAAAWRQRRSSQ